MEIRLEALTSPEAKARMEQRACTAVLPVGSVEQHGPHCPLGTDGLIARALALETARRLDAICLPPVWYGISPHHMNFPGSMTVRPQVLSMYLADIMDSLARHGIRSILVLNGHGGNTASIAGALMEMREKHPDLFLAQSSVWLALRDAYDTLPEEARQENWSTLVSHAGLFETSAIMALDEGLVKLDNIEPVPVEPFIQAYDPVMTLTLKFERVAPKGYGGDPRGANAELGATLPRFKCRGHRGQVSQGPSIAEAAGRLKTITAVFERSGRLERSPVWKPDVTDDKPKGGRMMKKIHHDVPGFVSVDGVPCSIHHPGRPQAGRHAGDRTPVGRHLPGFEHGNHGAGGHGLRQHYRIPAPGGRAGQHSSPSRHQIRSGGPEQDSLFPEKGDQVS